MKVEKAIRDSIFVKQAILNDSGLIQKTGIAARAIVKSYQSNNKILLCGNGGSAADAQHIAAELSGRYYYDRPPLFAEALHVNTSYLTAVSNDYGFDEVYARYVRAAGRKGDVLVSLSTSGNSPNVIKAMAVAKEKGMINIALTGETGGKMKNMTDILLNIPSADTPRIQESHILIGHIICQIVESEMFPNNK